MAAPSTVSPSTFGPSPVSPTLSTQRAQAELRFLIHNNTGRSPQHLLYGCSRVSARTIRCHPSWYDRVFIYAGTSITRQDRYGNRNTDFTGLRARRTCISAKHGVKRCAQRVSW